MKIIFPKKSVLRIVKFFSLVFLVFFISVFAFSSYFRVNYKDRVLPNVYFYDTEVSGMTKDEVGQIVGATQTEKNDFIKLKFDGSEVVASVADVGFSWDRERTTDDIMKMGRGNGLIDNFLNQLQVLFFKLNVKFSYNFDHDVAEKYLEELATTIDSEPVDGKMEIKDGKATVFNLSHDGRKLLIKKSRLDLAKALIGGEEKVTLTIEQLKAKNPSDIEKLGVTELFATGTSNFYGSPKNRVHNIKQGAEVFSGVLIPPGENFSFITTLGDVSAATGYLPELVIKEDRTIPEYGGGLCQVSTTFFRAAINAGFPIVERSPHAYRVSYYEPAGFDATIYIPKPDLVFQNNSSRHILIQTRVEGNNLYVDFYGTGDGREVTVYPPIIYNFVQPGEPILIETDELPPGEKEQIDTAHVGADAYFTRKIVYENGEIKEDRFDSRYVPWRAKFKVGKQQVSEENSEGYEEE